MRPTLQRLFVLALGALLPIVGVLRAPHARVVGTELSDVFKHTWSYWHALENLGGVRTQLLNYSEGGLFFDVMWGPAVLMSPVTAVFGPVLASNLWIFLSLWAVGLATWWLARELVGPGVGPVLAGLVAQTALPLLGYPLVSGVHERLAVWIFPVLVGCVLHARDHGGWRPALMGGSSLALAILGCQAYGLYGAAMLLLGLPIWLGHPRDWWPRFKRLAPLGVALLAVALVVYKVAHGLTVNPETLVPQPGRFLGDGPPPILEGASLSGMLDPRASGATQATLGGDELYVLTYLGWASVGLSIAGAAVHAGPRRWELRGLTALGLLMALLALGERFQIGAQGFVNPLFVALAAVLPHYDTNPPVWQHVMATAPLLAPGLAAAIERLPRWRLPAAGVALALILGERALALPVSFPLPTTEARVPAIYEQIHEPGAVAEVPRLYKDYTTSHGHLFLAQTEHERPVPFTINIGASPWDSYAPLARGVAPDWGAAAACLRSAGYRYLVLHRDHFSEPRVAEEALRGLSRSATPVEDDGLRVLFDLGPVEDPPRSAGPALSRSSMELVQVGLAGRALDRLDPEWERCPAK